MWRQIRGQGLAYHYGLSLDVEAGFLAFRLSQSTNLVKAYQVAREIFVSKCKFWKSTAHIFTLLSLHLSRALAFSSRHH